MRRHSEQYVQANLLHRVESLITHQDGYDVWQVRNEVDHIRDIAYHAGCVDIARLAESAESALSLHGTRVVVSEYLQIMRDRMVDATPAIHHAQLARIEMRNVSMFPTSM